MYSISLAGNNEQSLTYFSAPAREYFGLRDSKSAYFKNKNTRYFEIFRGFFEIFRNFFFDI